MNRSILLPAVYFADQIGGDPEWLPHPVRLMGLAITAGERLLRWQGQSEEVELLAGGLLTATVVVASSIVTSRIISGAYRRSKLLGRVTEAALGWTCLAARNLHDEASQVLNALDAGDIVLARRRLARIVGRDTKNLDFHEISRAVIETLAESASDGVVAPITYMSLGGVPLAMAFKAINTLDSMVGHADDRYRYFGKVAARLDDVANFVPARLTAIAIVAAASFSRGSPRDAAMVWLRDGNKHKSPNAGQPESAMAGAVGVRLGGGNFYNGEFVPAAPMGEEYAAPEPHHARKALRIVSIVALLGVSGGLVLSIVSRTGRNG